MYGGGGVNNFKYHHISLGSSGIQKSIKNDYVLDGRPFGPHEIKVLLN